jgi:tetratricopeptide (TPR) repeat protein
MRDWTVSYLRDELKKQDSNLSIWPDESNFFRPARVPLVAPSAAEETASGINADLLIYGYIDTRVDPAQLVLNFWVAPQNRYKFEDIQGSALIGKPIRVLDLKAPGIAVQGELQSQSVALAYIAMGLAQEQLGQTQDALNSFLKAEAALPQSEIVQYFIGREYLSLAEFNPGQQEEIWQKAEGSFLKSIDLNDQYAKAYLGLGSVYIKQSAELLKVAKASSQAVDPRSLQLAEQGIAAYEKVLGLKPGPGLAETDQNLAQLALGNAYQQKGAILYYQQDYDSALQTFDAAAQTLEAVRSTLAASVPDHESYRRYLVQSDEYLGTVYQWLGSTYAAKQEYEKAFPAYQKSIAAFGQCLVSGKGSPDLIIQNDIIGKYCQPKLEEVQQLYDELKGSN